MARNCATRHCLDCHDALIHQSARGAHESSSVLGQYVHDHPDKQFYWMDVDGLVYKSSDRRLRFIEHKPLGSVISRGQGRILPILATALDLAKREGIINQGSVVTLTGNPPFDVPSTATLYLPDGTTRTHDLNREQVDQLVTGRSVSFRQQEAA